MVHSNVYYIGDCHTYPIVNVNYIGAGAVVTKSFEQNGVSLAGVPAKIVASRKDSKKAD